jgi:hypothetical protein
LNDGHAVLPGYLGMAEMIMVEPPEKREVCPPNLAGKAEGNL